MIKTFGNVTRVLAAGVVLLAAGCAKTGGEGLSPAEAAALVSSDAVVDLVRITRVRDVGGVIEIGCASQVPVQIVSEYPGPDGPKSVKHDVEPPMTTLRIEDLNRDSGGIIVLTPR